MEVIKIKDLSKSFKLYQDKPNTLKERALRTNKNTHRSLDILKNINLSINKGEMVALIGHNGSGKSTLLKLLTKIIYPNKGDIKIEGRVSSLLELGAGFHPDFTGMENIFMNASIFGLTKKEIELKVDDIISFSELEEFIHNPVRTYSSGMYMRLAFAVAINIEPDILLVDEVLAVGDASFQRKCLNRIKELKNAGKTIVLVTHDHGVVERMCDRAIWLHNGEVKNDGHPKDVVNEYLRYLADRDQEKESKQIQSQTHSEEELAANIVEEESASSHGVDMKRWGTKEVKIMKMAVVSEDVSNHIYSESGLKLIIDYTSNLEDMSSVVFGIAIHTLDKIRVYGTNTQIESISRKKISKKGRVELYFPQLNLIEGDYNIDIAVHDETGKMFDYITDAVNIRVLSEVHDVGYCRIPHKWTFTEGEGN